MPGTTRKQMQCRVGSFTGPSSEVRGIAMLICLLSAGVALGQGNTPTGMPSAPPLTKAAVPLDSTHGQQQPTPLYMIPNFHDACMGWLVSYAEERNFGLYSYLAHLDHAATDPTYKFVMSEIPHLITLMEFEPRRMEELRQRIAEGRVELCNAFVLEPTVSLSGGEALVQQGVLGLRWYDEVMQARPRSAWMIDLCGWHEQMAQITSGLGLEAFVYCRYNPTGPPPNGEPQLTNWDEIKCGSALHWITSPDGSRVLAVSPGLYCDVEFQPVFRTTQALADGELSQLVPVAEMNQKRFPANVPMVLFGGEWDYSLPFHYPGYPRELVQSWNRLAPHMPMTISTFGEYLDAILPALREEEKVPLPSAAHSKYGWTAFWVNAPLIKQRFRRTEQRLQTAESLATIASLRGDSAYPAQQFSNAWFLTALNMDRNVLWGAGVDASFADEYSWDACDRFEYVDTVAHDAEQAAWKALAQTAADSIVLYNPVNWTRRAPFEVALPEGTALADAPCQSLPGESQVLVNMPLESMSLTTAPRASATAAEEQAIDLAAPVTTRFYEARIDPLTGALASLKCRVSGRQILGGAGNVVLAETGGGVHNIAEKSNRKLLASSEQYTSRISAVTGPVATIVEASSVFLDGGKLRRVIRFYHDSPRVDFMTEVHDVPTGTVLSVEFPFAERIAEVRRGVPFGFSHGDPMQSNAAQTGVTQGILPAIQFTDYAFPDGSGVALLDRGIPGRELTGHTAALLLHNVLDAYALSWKINDQEFSEPSELLNGHGKQVFEYALYVHPESWEQAAVPQAAWEYNSPVVVTGQHSARPAGPAVETSDNVIVAALRRVDDEMEIRLVECLGLEGDAHVRVHLPHMQAARTDLMGNRREVLAGGPDYRLVVKPQQIVTLRLRTEQAVPRVHALRSFRSVVPPAKWEYMHALRKPHWRGHPPAAP